MSYSGYQNGVYGTRNVCSQIINNGYASFAFVSDMSTGYSGNLGFPMPRQWSFDQFVEFTIGSGNGAVGMDLIATWVEIADLMSYQMILIMIITLPNTIRRL